MCLKFKLLKCLKKKKKLSIGFDPFKVKLAIMNDSFNNPHLSVAANNVVSAGKAPSTLSSYSSAIRMFLDWCEDNNFVPYIPIDNYLLVEYFV